LLRLRAWRALENEEAATSSTTAETSAGVKQAARELLQRLPPREHAAVLMRDVLDLSAREAAGFQQITEGAVKSALHRARELLQEEQSSEPAAALPSKALLDRFLNAMASNDMATMKAICLADLTVVLVGGARSDTFEDSRSFFRPRALGARPRKRRRSRRQCASARIHTGASNSTAVNGSRSGFAPGTAWTG
jgi:hypothetical protein